MKKRIFLIVGLIVVLFTLTGCYSRRRYHSKEYIDRMNTLEQQADELNERLSIDNIDNNEITKQEIRDSIEDNRESIENKRDSLENAFNIDIIGNTLTNKLDLNRECQISVRNNKEVDYVAITDEVIKSNLIQLLIETIHTEEVILMDNGEIYYDDEKQLKVGLSSVEEYCISFCYYTEVKDGDIERIRAITVDDGMKIQNYLVHNDLYAFLCYALKNDSKTLTVDKYNVNREDDFVTVSVEPKVDLHIYYHDLPKHIEEGSILEISLARAEATRNGLYAETITSK